MLEYVYFVLEYVFDLECFEVNFEYIQVVVCTQRIRDSQLRRLGIIQSRLGLRLCRLRLRFRLRRLVRQLRIHASRSLYMGDNLQAFLRCEQLHNRLGEIPQNKALPS